MSITDKVVKNIIKKLLQGEDYRVEVIALINAEFLRFAVAFFKKVAEAKLSNKAVNVDWYKKTFLDPNLNASEIAINSGLNKKTINNMYNSATKEIVIDASNNHYDTLYKVIKTLVEAENELAITLTIKFRNVSVDLNIGESLIVINALAVKRAALRGGFWSTAGKKVEKPLMVTLCKLFEVPSKNFLQKEISNQLREVDFYLKVGEKVYKSEVKLMGKGNPESADAIFARESNIFIADKLSDLNKRQANQLGVNWVELRTEKGYLKFGAILSKLNIPHSKPSKNINYKVDAILKEIFDKKR